MGCTGKVHRGVVGGKATVSGGFVHKRNRFGQAIIEVCIDRVL